LLAVLNLTPTPRLAWLSGDIADDCLSSGMDVDVLNTHGLLASATQLR
jgi:hypothetical protein